MFSSARIKLTAYYLLIIMIISISFSVIIFQRVNTDFQRFERMQQRIQRDFDDDDFFTGPNPHRDPISEEDLELVKAARNRFIFNLILINLLIFASAGTAAYFLSGLTLRPIKEMMDEQNRFIADSSHEFRTPLTVLRSETEIALLDKNLNLEKAKKVLKSNLEEVENLSYLSDKLLDLAQGKSLVNKKVFEEINIANVLNLSVEKTEKLATNKKIKIIYKPVKAKILGDKDSLVELFVILIDNAIKYSKTKSEVKVIAIKNKNLQVEISNFDSYIEPKDLNKIFDRFYRADKSRSEDGFGLGLAIAKQIVDRHGAEIKVKSSEKETKFIVGLPLL